jgi:hypothetical protein
MTMLFAARVMRSTLIAALLLTLAVAEGGVDATALPGCDAVNAKAFDGETYISDRHTFKRTVSPFSTGDTLSFRVSCSDGCQNEFLVKLTSGDDTDVSAGRWVPNFWGRTLSYTVTGDKMDTTLTFFLFKIWAGATSRVTCSAGAEAR